MNKSKKLKRARRKKRLQPLTLHVKETKGAVTCEMLVELHKAMKKAAEKMGIGLWGLERYMRAMVAGSLADKTLPPRPTPDWAKQMSFSINLKNFPDFSQFKIARTVVIDEFYADPKGVIERNARK